MAAVPAARASAAAEAGLPYLQSFAPSDYGGGGQNWAITQDPRGLIYVGNGDDGVMEFDGIRWRRIALPKRTIVRSLAVGSDGRVYVGAQGEFGVLAPDAAGEMRYESLVPGLGVDERGFADVWRIHPVRDDIYFFSPQILFRLREGRVESWQSATPFHLSFEVDGRILLRKAGEGLVEFVDGAFQPLPGGERFAEERVYAMLPWNAPSGAQKAQLLIGTRTQGWLRFDGRDYHPWPTQADAAMTRDLLYVAERLAADRFAFGTLQGGLTLLDHSGAQQLRLDSSTGLADDSVFAMHQDREAGLWLGTGQGVARISQNRPLSRFDARSGLIGAVLAIERHQGALYVGTTRGLFRLEAGAGSNARFVREPEVPGLVWSLLRFDDALLAVSLTGVFELRDGRLRRILDNDGSMSLLRSRVDPARVFVGSSGGLRAMRRVGTGWVVEPLHEPTGAGLYTLAEDALGRLWMGTRGENVYRATFQGPASGAPLADAVLERFSVEHGLAEGMTDVYLVDGRPVFATDAGILEFDEAAGRFAPVEGLQGLFPDGPRRLGALHQDHHGRIWAFSESDSLGTREVGAVVPAGKDGLRWDGARLLPIAGAAYLAFQVDDDGVVWIGGEDALHRYDPALDVADPLPFRALVRRVTGRDERVLYGGAGPLPQLELEAGEGSLRFEFAAPSYDMLDGNRYQVWLEGVDTTWSTWRAEGYRDYTKIPPGTHRFRVRARNVYGARSQEAVLELRILPPWYMTWKAYLAWLLLGVLALWAGLRWHASGLLRRNEELEALVARRTEELSGANRALESANRALAEQSVTDPLTGLKNRRHVVQNIATDIALVDRAFRDSGGAAMLLFFMVDIDDFKSINDRFGHDAGDAILAQFGALLRRISRRADTPVRWGGEEFLLISHSGSARDGALLAERIRAEVADTDFELGDGRSIRCTCSVGFAGYPFFGGQPERVNWEQVVAIADQCMYLAKRRGRNAWAGAVADTEAAAARTGGIDGSLEHLLADGGARLLTSGTPTAGG
ncbi:diguanylate cyclase [Luteimonas sp. SJ-92]|uniref:diguanylate cyclase n=1 Tax=Luteimonas salinisoli TaxID=2752307 RepID=A0A853J7C1_9GAMM|nr:diguanylate cyclase [Luteimonas salinisoli]NZA25016.1 diguanylate cyclase [Luteimonas salinisoli]